MEIGAGCGCGAPGPGRFCSPIAGDAIGPPPPLDAAALILANLIHLMADMTARVQAGRRRLTHFAAGSAAPT